MLEAKHQVSAAGETIYKLRKTVEESTPGKTPAASTAEEFIPEQRIFGSKVLLTPGTQVRDAGWYRLGVQGDSTLTLMRSITTAKSDLTYKNEEVLSEGLLPNMKVLSQTAEANFSQIVGEQERGIVRRCARSVCFVIFGPRSIVSAFVESLVHEIVFRVSCFVFGPLRLRQPWVV
ncbi:MAG: hypothetical protein IPL27_26210 [Lewinellaceae bacterium]|nr:hypothetical protein [Lewinellaceae bacterium]